MGTRQDSGPLRAPRGYEETDGLHAFQLHSPFTPYFLADDLCLKRQAADGRPALIFLPSTIHLQKNLQESFSSHLASCILSVALLITVRVAVSNRDRAHDSKQPARSTTSCWIFFFCLRQKKRAAWQAARSMLSHDFKKKRAAWQAARSMLSHDFFSWAAWQAARSMLSPTFFREPLGSPRGHPSKRKS